MVVRLTKYNVYRYIGCISDQSNWSGPFSLVVMTHDFESEGRVFKSRSGHSTGSFYLQLYFSSYYSVLILRLNVDFILVEFCLCTLQHVDIDTTNKLDLFALCTVIVSLPAFDQIKL